MDPHNLTTKTIESTLAETEAARALLVKDNEKMALCVVEALLLAQHREMPALADVNRWRKALGWKPVTPDTANWH